MGNSTDKINMYDMGIRPYKAEELLMHGIFVSNLAYRISREMGMNDEFCEKIAMAGVLHDIGKLRIYRYIYGENNEDQMEIEKNRYIRMHSQIGYDILSTKDFDKDILEAILYHHENYDGSGYPSNLSGEDIPISARILRVCDVFAALTSDIPYRDAFDEETAIELMIDEVKNFDMKIFLTFLSVIHSVTMNELMGEKKGKEE